MTVGRSGHPAPLAARDAYGLWAPTYDRETAVSALENRGVGALSPPLSGRALLDAGCGTGRRLPSPSPDGPSLVVGLDLVLGMLAREGVCVIVTDLHPEAARAPSVRTFRDTDGVLHAVEHHLHEVADHEREARRAGLWLDARLDLMVGPEVRCFYEEAGALRRYEEQRGLPVVLALRLVG